jgi:hypothetical protein
VCACPVPCSHHRLRSQFRAAQLPRATTQWPLDHILLTPSPPCSPCVSLLPPPLHRIEPDGQRPKVLLHGKACRKTANAKCSYEATDTRASIEVRRGGWRSGVCEGAIYYALQQWRCYLEGVEWVRHRASGTAE